MIVVVADTNVLVGGSLGVRSGAASRTIQAVYAGEYQLAFSPATLDELLDNLNLPRIRHRLGWSDDDVVEYLMTLQAGGRMYSGSYYVPHVLTRDVTDTKFLALSAEANADYLITNDRRHLLRLRWYRQTKIVTPAQFLRELASAQGRKP